MLVLVLRFGDSNVKRMLLRSHKSSMHPHPMNHLAEKSWKTSYLFQCVYFFLKMFVLSNIYLQHLVPHSFIVVYNLLAKHQIDCMTWFFISRSLACSLEARYL